MSDTKKAHSGAAEGARRATEQSPESGGLAGEVIVAAQNGSDSGVAARRRVLRQSIG